MAKKLPLLLQPRLPPLLLLLKPLLQPLLLKPLLLLKLPPQHRLPLPLLNLQSTKLLTSLIKKPTQVGFFICSGHSP